MAGKDRAPRPAPPGDYGSAPGLDVLVEHALAEDVGDGDRTTLWTVPSERRGRARLVAREAGVVAGTVPAGRVFRRVGPELEVSWEVEDGAAVEAGQVVGRVEGRLRPILTAERTALNFLGRLSGVASLTRRFVDAAAATGASIVDTRKTTPGWRALEKRATAAGGARNHRMGLYDMVLVKENHARAAGGVREALRRVRERARSEGIPVVIEVADLEELEAVLADPPDRILLDNMEPRELRRAVERVGEGGEPRPRLEASGGVSLRTVRRVAETGVDLVSVGAITHSSAALDLSLLLEEA